MMKASNLTALTPPDGWACVESGIYRANALSQANVSFFRLTGVRTVVNMSTVNLRLANSLSSAGMTVFQPCVSSARDDTESPEDDTRSQISDEIAKECLQYLLESSHHPLVLTAPNSGGLEVATLVGCLRRLQVRVSFVLLATTGITSLMLAQNTALVNDRDSSGISTVRSKRTPL
jgi:hypothetical protein